MRYAKRRGEGALKKPTDRQTDRQTDQQRDRQTDGKTDRQADRQTELQVANRLMSNVGNMCIFVK